MNEDQEATRAVIGEVGNRIQNNLMHITDMSTGGAVFGSPEHVGDRVVITASTYSRAGGFGFGGGGGKPDAMSEFGAGGGGGGGGTSEGRPVAIIDIGPEGVTIRPVFDFTKLGLAALGGALAVWRAGRSTR
ncbi:MAG: hypothetical protein OEM94_08580 [Acidimicrobiia bacterium]|nr:hypothetical protein [Acidimicrobiia bacterium]